MKRIWVVLILIAGFGCPASAQEKPKINREAAKDIAVTSGSEMFQAYCAACH